MINEERVKRLRSLIYVSIISFLLVPVILMIILFSRMILLTNSMIRYFDGQTAVTDMVDSQ